MRLFANGVFRSGRDMGNCVRLEGFGNIFSYAPYKHKGSVHLQQQSDHISSIGYGVAVTSLTLTSQE